jgi:hypothetical protein
MGISLPPDWRLAERPESFSNIYLMVMFKATITLSGCSSSVGDTSQAS